MLVANHVTGDPEEVDEEVGTQRKSQKIKGQRPRAKSQTRTLVRLYLKIFFPLYLIPLFKNSEQGKYTLRMFIQEISEDRCSE